MHYFLLYDIIKDQINTQMPSLTSVILLCIFIYVLSLYIGYINQLLVKMSDIHYIKDSLHRAFEGIRDFHIALSSSYDQKCIYFFMKPVFYSKTRVY